MEAADSEGFRRPGGPGGPAGGSSGSPGGANGASEAPSPLLTVVLGMLRSGGAGGGLGGLGGLLRRLDEAGLADQARSWVQPGRNQPVSGREITRALGAEELDRLAARTGLAREEAAAGIAATLPQVVDAVTPGGEVPSEKELDEALAQFLRETAPPN